MRNNNPEEFSVVDSDSQLCNPYFQFDDRWTWEQGFDESNFWKSPCEPTPPVIGPERVIARSSKARVKKVEPTQIVPAV